VSPHYVVLGGQRGAAVGRAGDEIDASSKDSAASRVLPGRVKVTVTCDALFIPTDAAYQALDAAQKGRQFIMVEKYVEGVPVAEARAIITDLSEDHPDMDTSTVSVGLSIDGDWEPITS
jgi:hypothetical protein